MLPLTCNGGTKGVAHSFLKKDLKGYYYFVILWQQLTLQDRLALRMTLFLTTESVRTPTTETQHRAKPKDLRFYNARV